MYYNLVINWIKDYRTNYNTLYKSVLLVLMFVCVVVPLCSNYQFH